MDIKIPPQDITSEMNVLGCCMLKTDAVEYAIKHLKASDFIKPEHQRIFEVIVDLSDREQAIDMLIVNEKYDDITYLTQITSDVVTTSNYKSYVKIVKGKSVRRLYIKAGENILQNCYHGTYNTVTEFKSDCLEEMDIETGEATKTAYKMSDIMNGYIENLTDKHENGKKTRISTGYRWLDEVIGGIVPNYTILAARPSIGKSTLAINIMIKLALQGKKVAMFNLEMSKYDIMDKMISIISKTNNNKIRNTWELNESEIITVMKTCTKLVEQNIYIIDDIYEIEKIRYECRSIKNSSGLDAVFVDYLQLCNTKKKTGNSNEKTTHISRQFKLMQKEFNVPFWVLSQLSRESAKEKNRKPILTDLRDSGSIEQDADTVIFLHDPHYGDYEYEKVGHAELKLIVAKQRLGVRDVEGDFKYYKNTQTIYDYYG